MEGLCLGQHEGAGYDGFVAENPGGEVGRREASEIGGGRHPAEGCLVPWGGKGGEALSECGGLSEARLDLGRGRVPDDMADRGFEHMQKIFGFLFGAIRFGAASFGVGWGRVVGAVVMLEGYEQLKPGDAWGGPVDRGDLEAVEKSSDTVGLRDGVGTSKGFDGPVIQVDGDRVGGVEGPTKGLVDVDLCMDGGADVVDFLVCPPKILVLPHDGYDEVLYSDGERGVVCGPLLEILVYDGDAGVMGLGTFSGLEVGLEVAVVAAGGDAALI